MVIEKPNEGENVFQGIVLQSARVTERDLLGHKGTIDDLHTPDVLPFDPKYAKGLNIQINKYNDIDLDTQAGSPANINKHGRLFMKLDISSDEDPNSPVNLEKLEVRNAHWDRPYTSEGKVNQSFDDGMMKTGRDSDEGVNHKRRKTTTAIPEGTIKGFDSSQLTIVKTPKVRIKEFYTMFYVMKNIILEKYSSIIII